jgi:hypothetical protein
MVGSPVVIAGKARARLQSVITSMREGRSLEVEGQAGVAKLPASADVIVTPCEVNELHGTGTLLLRVFQDSSSIVSLRTSNFYDGRQSFGAARFCLPLAQVSRRDVASWLRWYIGGMKVRRILTTPYMPADAELTLATQETSGAALCTYIMDDKNVCAEGISDSLMRELLSKSDLRLVIGPEMRDAYEDKYGMKFWVMPPLVPEELVHRTPRALNGVDPRRGVLLGNIWGQRWLDMLRTAFRGSGFSIDWYCNSSNPAGLSFDRAEMERDGVRFMEPVEESRLPSVLSKYPFAVVPSDTLDGSSPASVRAIAELSLPSRIPTIVATSHLPVLVMGHPSTSAAGFVSRFELGAVVPYETAAVKRTLKDLLRPERQTAIRQRAAALSGSLSAHGSAEWIWRSLDQGRACDSRYEDLMPRCDGALKTEYAAG